MNPRLGRMNPRLNLFWKNTRLEKHRPDDPLNTDPPAAPPTGPHNTICGACGCKIARSGEILATGETYKKFLKHEQTLEKKDREIEAANTEITRLKAEVAALNTKLGEGSASGHRPGGRIR
jgi:hypothetical protein